MGALFSIHLPIGENNFYKQCTVFRELGFYIEIYFQFFTKENSLWCGTECANSTFMLLSAPNFILSCLLALTIQYSWNGVFDSTSCTSSKSNLTSDGLSLNWQQPVEGVISSRFGWRFHPIYRTKRWHSGIDIAAPIGATVVSIGDGYVARSKYAGGYGEMVEIAHPGGLRTRYAHLSKIAIKAGQKVRAGDTLGWVGNTGVSTGPHLHLEMIYNGVELNPEIFIN